MTTYRRERHVNRSLTCKNLPDIHLPEGDGNVNMFPRDKLSYNVVKNENLRSNKSTTLMKEIHRQREDSATHDKHCDFRQILDSANKTDDYQPSRNYSIFAPRMPCMSLLSPTKSVRKKRQASVRYHGVANDKEQEGQVTSPGPARSSRYAPYESPSKPYDIIEYPLTKRVTDQPRYETSSSAKLANDVKKAGDKYIKPSFTQRLCRKPSVKSFRSPRSSSSVRNPLYIPATSRPKLKASQNKTDIVKQRNDMSELPITKKWGLKTSVKEADSIPNRSKKPTSSMLKVQTVNNNGNIKKPPSFRTERSSVSVKSVLKNQKSVHSTQIGNAASRRLANDKQDISPCVDTVDRDVFSTTNYQRSCNSRRRLSVISTKARKHSSPSPQSPDYTFNKKSIFSRPIKRGKNLFVSSAES